MYIKFFLMSISIREKERDKEREKNKTRDIKRERAKCKRGEKVHVPVPINSTLKSSDAILYFLSAVMWGEEKFRGGKNCRI